MKRRVIVSEDEEWGFESRVSSEIEEWLKKQDIDCVNNQYIVTVDFSKTNE